MSLRIALVGCGSMGLNHARVIATGPGHRARRHHRPRRGQRRRRAADLYDARWAPDARRARRRRRRRRRRPHRAPPRGRAADHRGRPPPPRGEAGVPLRPGHRDGRRRLRARRRAADVRPARALQPGRPDRVRDAGGAAARPQRAPLAVRAADQDRGGVGPAGPRRRPGRSRPSAAATPPRSTCSRGHFHPVVRSPGAEDVVEASLGFAGGGIASVSASRIGQRKVRSMVISELDRMIEVDLLRRGRDDLPPLHHRPRRRERLGLPPEHRDRGARDHRRRAAGQPAGPLRGPRRGPGGRGARAGLASCPPTASSSRRCPSVAERPPGRSPKPSAAQTLGAGRPSMTSSGSAPGCSTTRPTTRAGTPATMRARRHVGGDHRTGRHHGLVADRDAHVDHGAGADEDPVADGDRAALDHVVVAAADAPLRRGVGVDLHARGDVAPGADGQPARRRRSR